MKDEHMATIIAGDMVGKATGSALMQLTSDLKNNPDVICVLLSEHIAQWVHKVYIARPNRAIDNHDYSVLVEMIMAKLHGMLDYHIETQ